MSVWPLINWFTRGHIRLSTSRGMSTLTIMHVSAADGDRLDLGFGRKLVRPGTQLLVSGRPGPDRYALTGLPGQFALPVVQVTGSPLGSAPTGMQAGRGRASGEGQRPPLG